VSHSNRNFAIAYVFLVALPIAGLVGILRSGRGLNVPTSVDGVWKVQAAVPKGTVSPCLSVLGLDPETPVAISQSGRNFAINAGNVGGSGAIDSSNLQASLSPMPRGRVADCAGDGLLALSATVDATTNPRVMSGVLSVAGCASCGSVEFQAVRQSTQEKGAQ